MPTYLYPSSSHSRSSSSGSHYRGSSYSPSHHRHSTYGGSVYGHGSSYGNHGSRSQHSYAPPYQYTSSSGSRGYGSRSAYPVYGDYGRDHHRDYSRSGARHQYVTQDTGRHHGHGLFGHHQQHHYYGHTPSLGERIKWMFGFGHNNYHNSGKRRSVDRDGRRHDARGRHIYTV